MDNSPNTLQEFNGVGGIFTVTFSGVELGGKAGFYYFNGVRNLGDSILSYTALECHDFHPISPLFEL